MVRFSPSPCPSTPVVKIPIIEVLMAKILIAEDERDIRDLITFTLKLAGHDVTTTSNGEDAFLQAKKLLQEQD